MSKTILIVDDARLMRNILKDALSSSYEAYEFIEAQNGKEAVQVYKEKKPDLVTMDVTMEVLNGIDAAREILKHDPTARIIMVTALGQEKLLNECIDAGVCDFIVKPFKNERIVTAVRKALTPRSPIQSCV